MKIENVPLIKIVDPVRGNSLYTKEYGEKHKGEYAVFSASNSRPLSHIDSYDYDGEFLTWATNGFGGFIKVLNGRFSVNGDRGVLKIKPGVSVDVEYLRYALEPILRSLAKGRKGDRGKNEFTKVPMAVIKKALVPMPIDPSGAYDLAEQKNLVKKYRSIEVLRTYLSSEAASLEETAIDIPVLKNSLLLSIGQIFDLDVRTNFSSFTKQFVDQHKGNIPVYSASKDESSTGYGMVADNLPDIAYFEDTLTWNIDGSVGKAFFRKGRFTLSEKVIPLVLKKEWEGLIDDGFVKYALEEKAVEGGFDFTKKAGKSRIKDIEIEFPKTTDSKGNPVPDYDEQKRLAQKYRDVYELKSQVVSELREITALGVSI